MKTEELSKIVERRITDLRETLSVKGAEYAKFGDRLSNFKIAGNLLGQSPSQALLGMVVKHIVALVDFTNCKFEGVSDAQFDEKVGDIIAYMCLLDGLYTEKHRKDK